MNAWSKLDLKRVLVATEIQSQKQCVMVTGQSLKVHQSPIKIAKRDKKLALFLSHLFHFPT